MTRLKLNKRSPSIVKHNKPKRLTGLGQTARSQVGCSRVTRRERSTAGVESEPNSSIRDGCGTWKSCTLARFAPGRPHRKAGQEPQHRDDRKSQRRGIMPRICPRRSGLSWQENKQNHREERKANDGSARG